MKYTNSNTFSKAIFALILPVFLANLMPVLVFAANVPQVSQFSGSSSATSIVLSWNTPSGNDYAEFEIRESLNPISESNFIMGTQVSGAPQPIPGATQTVSISGLQENTKYYFGIRLYNMVGEASPVTVISATTNANGGGGTVTDTNGCPSPTSVLSVSATPTTNSIYLSWQTPSENNLAEFDIRVSGNQINGSNFDIASQVSGAPQPLIGRTQGVQINGLEPNKVYYFAIRVFNMCGGASPLALISQKTNEVSVSGCSSPLAVNNVSTNVTSNSVTLSWLTPSQNNLSEFDIRVSKNSINEGNFNIMPQISGVPQPLSGRPQSVVVSDLTSNTEYNFAIRVFNMCGASSPLALVSAVTSQGGGGGGGGGGGVPTPVLPPTGEAIVINNGAAKTDNVNVTLALTAKNVSQMKISNNSDLSGGTWEAFTDTKKWVLTSGDGTKRVYVKYRNPNNEESTLVYDDIILETQASQPPVIPPVQPPVIIPVQPRPQGEVRGASTRKGLFDFNTLMVNWGMPRLGNYSDLNSDAKVDNKDVFVLMKNWVDITVNR